MLHCSKKPNVPGALPRRNKTVERKTMSDATRVAEVLCGERHVIELKNYVGCDTLPAR